MKMPLPFTSVVAAALLLAGLGAITSHSGATSLRGNGSPEGAPDSSPKAATMTKPEVVKSMLMVAGRNPLMRQIATSFERTQWRF